MTRPARSPQAAARVLPLPAGTPPGWPAAAARLETDLRRAGQHGRPLLGGCLPAGCPVPRRGESAWAALAETADLLEVALPTSDAYLDGPVMRSAHARALDAGWTPGHAVSLVASLASAGPPVLVMAYWHTLARYGPGTMARALARAGAAGIVIADLPAGTAAGWARIARGEGLHTVLLAGSPDTADLAELSRFATAAVYVPASPGPTGADRSLDPALGERVALARSVTGLHVVTGVGVTTPARARAAAASGASAVIVGSALTRAASGPDPGRAVRDVAAQFAAAVNSGPAPRPEPSSGSGQGSRSLRRAAGRTRILRTARPGSRGAHAPGTRDRDMPGPDRCRPAETRSRKGQEDQELRP